MVRSRHRLSQSLQVRNIWEGYKIETLLARNGKEDNERLLTFWLQPSLHPQSRSHPEVRFEHLPSVLQGEECGYWFC